MHAHSLVYNLLARGSRAITDRAPRADDTKGAFLIEVLDVEFWLAHGRISH